MFLGTTHLTEGSAIDSDDGALDERLGSHKLVVRRVVDDIDDSALSGSSLGGPGEGSLNSRVENLRQKGKLYLVESKSSVLDVSTSSSDGVNSLRLELGHGLGAGLKERSLLAGHWSPTAGGAALMH